MLSLQLTIQRDHSASIVDQCVDQIEIQTRSWLAGSKLPSIRELAQQAQLSRFTVTHVYDKLVARGTIEAKVGVGFFLVKRQLPKGDRTPVSSVDRPDINVAWLLRRFFQENPTTPMPASGNLPVSWLDETLVSHSLRAVARSAGSRLLGYGSIQGYLPLRQQIAIRLQQEGIAVEPHQLLTTSGVTHALDLIIRYFVKPGDTVFVEDPGWFLVFARLANTGVHVVGVPRTITGPDVESLERLAQQHRPKFFLMNSVVHNPTGYSLQVNVAYEVLRLAEKYQFWLLEDDTYSELSASTPLRLATLDGLKRVLLIGGFSKTLSANLRVGYIAASTELIDELSNVKALSLLTSTEISERVVYRILSEGGYRRLVERIRVRANHARFECVARLPELGVKLEQPPEAGFFLWVDCQQDTEALAAKAVKQKLILAPGHLFSPKQESSTYMRLAVSIIEKEEIWQQLRAVLNA